MSNIVHVVGTGTIGEPFVGLLCDLKKELGIDEVTFYKHSPMITDIPKVKGLLRRGGVLTVRKERLSDFRELGLEPTYTAEEAIKRATVVVDCCPKGIGLENKERYYTKYQNTVKGFLAQGSEFGFGKMYAAGINEKAIHDEKYIHIVSCNTHNIAVAIKAASMGNPQKNFVNGRFVCIRRANDISQYTGFIPSPEVNKHYDDMGTHHARDVYHLYKTIGLDLDVFSSAIKTNTQYMHTIWFSICLKNKVTREEIEASFQENHRVAVTNKTMANVVFSFGRDHGHYGRILNQTVLVLPTLHVRKDTEVVGFCFTPQDGNSLLSSVSAVEHLLYPDDYMEKLQALNPFLFDEV